MVLLVVTAGRVAMDTSCPDDHFPCHQPWGTNSQAHLLSRVLVMYVCSWCILKNPGLHDALTTEVCPQCQPCSSFPPLTGCDEAKQAASVSPKWQSSISKSTHSGYRRIWDDFWTKSTTQTSKSQRFWHAGIFFGSDGLLLSFYLPTRFWLQIYASCFYMCFWLLLCQGIFFCCRVSWKQPKHLLVRKSSDSFFEYQSEWKPYAYSCFVL